MISHYLTVFWVLKSLWGFRSKRSTFVVLFFAYHFFCFRCYTVWFSKFLWLLSLSRVQKLFYHSFVSLSTPFFLFEEKVFWLALGRFRLTSTSVSISHLGSLCQQLFSLFLRKSYTSSICQSTGSIPCLCKKSLALEKCRHPKNPW